MEWSPDSYRRFPARHQPEYSSEKRYRESILRLADHPPIVFPGEVDSLKTHIAKAGAGASFLLQGGDCVELFADCRDDPITNKFKILLQMSVVLTYAARRPVVRIGRIAGQYFKPRSQTTERTAAGPMPVYRGDGINGIEATSESRANDPGRLERAYFHAAATLNYIRAMISGGFADLHNPYNWNLHDIEHTARWAEYRAIVEHITDAVSFMESFGGARGERLGDIDFFTSHEALHLGYEAALTRRLDEGGGWYNLGAHMLWIGERTRKVDEAHVEYARGIENPIGVKIGPGAEAERIVELATRLNPRNEPGKLVFITRLGADRVQRELPGLLDAVRRCGSSVVWSCDPMHGNTHTTADGIKTRRFDSVLRELEETFSVHERSGGRLSGVHFELTGENVTECTGGSLDLRETDLSRNYRSYCDPRLNYAQSMEMSFLISHYVRTSQA